MIRNLTAGDLEAYRAIRTEALDTDPDAFAETLDFFKSRTPDELQKWFERRVDPGREGIVVYEPDGIPKAPQESDPITLSYVSQSGLQPG